MEWGTKTFVSSGLVVVLQHLDMKLTHLFPMDFRSFMKSRFGPAAWNAFGLLGWSRQLLWYFPNWVRTHKLYSNQRYITGLKSAKVKKNQFIFRTSDLEIKCVLENFSTLLELYSEKSNINRWLRKVKNHSRCFIDTIWFRQTGRQTNIINNWTPLSW